MAIYRIIETGDIDIVGGKLVLISKDKAVRQKLSLRLKFFLGEWFLNKREGIPYYRDVLVRNPDLELIRSIYRQVITSVQEVTDVPLLELEYNPSERTLAVEFDARLVDGGVLQVRQPDTEFIVTVQTPP